MPNAKKKSGAAKPKKVAVYLPSINAAKKVLLAMKFMTGDNAAIEQSIRDGIKRTEARKKKA